MTDLPPKKPVFVARQTYRRRRMMEAARLLPVLGVCLLAVPLLWPNPEAASADVHPVPMSRAILYIFGVWALLIVLAALFGSRVRKWSLSDSETDGTQPADDADFEAR